MVDGILLIDKSSGPTSHDVVDSIRRSLEQKRVGHAGTLDPRATGLLVILLGQATRLAQWLQRHDKSYEGTIRLGIATDTGDADGRVTAEEACRTSDELLREATKTLIGRIEQTPPAYSAIKVNGQTAHRLARQGAPVELKSRYVTIETFETELAEPGPPPLVSFTVKCSSGTYIRSLAVDLGRALGCHAHLESLRRLSVGGFKVEDSVTAEHFSRLDKSARELLIMPMRVGLDMPEVTAAADDIAAIRNGVAFKGPLRKAVGGLIGSEAVKIISGEDGNLVGLGKIVEIESGESAALVKPFMVLVSN